MSQEYSLHLVVCQTLPKVCDYTVTPDDWYYFTARQCAIKTHVDILAFVIVREFAEVDEDFREHLAPNRNRCSVPVEEYRGALDCPLPTPHPSIFGILLGNTL